jgi:asparagine synthase (glutamine-hydrolysing)
LKGNTTKYILKKVAERYLPNEVIYRPKSGFGAPVRDWVVGELKDLVAQRLSVDRLNDYNIFDAQNVQQLIFDNQEGKIDASYTIWGLLAIDSWLRQFMPLD